MQFDKLYARSRLPTMSSAERKKSTVLVVDSEAQVRHTLRQSLASTGFEHVSDAPDHAYALQKLEERPFTHVIFEAKRTRIHPKEFLRRAFELDDSIIAIPSSYEPTVDDVFDLLVIGARGYLVKPFTADTLDTAMLMASKGEPISEAVLYAKDRNEALASLILSSLDKLSVITRQATQFETARRELPGRLLGFKRSVDIGLTFALGGPDALQEALVELCLDRSSGPATRLGRFRKHLEEKKGVSREPLSDSSVPAE